MCGIAGYNASPAWVTNHLNERTQFNVLEEAWLHNQHRGQDAAGYFRIDAENLKPYVRKSAQPASEILRDIPDDKNLLSPALVFAAHTRAKTLGDAADNRNNHPIEFQNVLVTHNGTISNHQEYKEKVPPNLKDQLGEVDSNAIAIALQTIESPYDMDAIVEVLAELRGGMAVHAVWKDMPGLSLLAKGSNSPMFVRFHPDGLFAYGSTDESVFAMIAAMGADPDDENWQIREMKDHAAVLIEDGMPIRWAKWNNLAWGQGLNRMDRIVQRIKNAFDKTEILSESDSSMYWAADPADRSLRAARQAKKTELVYTKKLGWRGSRKKTDFPYLGTSSVPQFRLAEADRIYENGKLMYATFGKVELVIEAGSSKLLDVYNHAEKVDRFEDVPKELILENHDSFDKWLEDATQRVFKPVDQPTLPRFMNIEQRALAGPTRGALKMASSPTTGKLHIAGTKEATSEQKEVRILNLTPEVSWSNVDLYGKHGSASMGFLSDIYCRQHSAMYSVHPRPTHCKSLVTAAIAFASCITDVTLWYQIAPELEIVTRLQRHGNDKADCKDLTGRVCKTWRPYMWRQVRIEEGDGYTQVMEVLVGEECVACSARMFIRELPDWMQEWTGDKVYVN